MDTNWLIAAAAASTINLKMHENNKTSCCVRKGAYAEIKRMGDAYEKRLYRKIYRNYVFVLVQECVLEWSLDICNMS